jgi:hypothetical protein
LGFINVGDCVGCYDEAVWLHQRTELLHKGNNVVKPEISTGHQLQFERAMEKQFIPPPLPKATPFQMFLAKVAGAKLLQRNGEYELTGYVYKGNLYIESMIKIVT